MAGSPEADPAVLRTEWVQGWPSRISSARMGEASGYFIRYARVKSRASAPQAGASVTYLRAEGGYLRRGEHTRLEDGSVYF
jgi:hypothetical protein